MWKDYSKSYIQNNRLSGLSVRIAALISAILLSLLCSVFYNLWKYETERIVLEEGGWQSRIVGEFSGEEIEKVRNYAGVKDIAVSQLTPGEISHSAEGESRGTETVIDLYF